MLTCTLKVLALAHCGMTVRSSRGSFCTVVLQKQIRTLRKGDLGFERTNQVALDHRGFEEATLMRDFLKQLPEIKEIITPHQPLFPLERYGLEKFLVKDFPELEKDMDLRSLQISEKYCQFYGLKQND